MQPLEVIEQDHISITDVVKAIRKDSDAQEPILREVELNAMLRICELMTQTGVIRVPAIIQGGIMAERDRVAIIASKELAEVQESAKQFRTGNK